MPLSLTPPFVDPGPGPADLMALPSWLCEQVVDAFTWSTNADGRAAALASLVHDLYDTTEWRLNGTNGSAGELESLQSVLLAVDAHRRRMSLPQEADAPLRVDAGHD